MNDAVPTGEDREPWAVFADAALQRLAAVHHHVDSAAAGAVDAGADAIDAQHQRAVDQARDGLFASMSGPSVFAALASNALLGPADVELFAIVLACESDARRQRLIGVVQGDSSRDRLTLHTVARLLGGYQRCAEAAGPGSALRRSALVEVVAEGPWSQHAVTVPESVMWALSGDLAPDPELPDGAFILADAVADGEPFVVVTGIDRVRRRNDAARQAAGTRFIVTPQPAEEAGWKILVREATLSGAGIIVELDRPLTSAGRRWLEQASHLTWALTSRTEIPVAEMPTRAWLEFDASTAPPSDAEWVAMLGDGVERTHHLTPQQLESVAKVLPARRGDLDAAVRRLLAGPLETLAKRIRPRRTWDDIVLSPERIALLRGIVSRYRHADMVYDEWGFEPIPSRGLVALFSGSSGTGKTLAAEIVAGELGLDMFKLDLSSVVSKYIGETEKNLDQVFDAAGAGNVVLFFDEADSLFGKRSEVKDARDRYANIEVSYLLQRLETYDGVVVMATNFEKNIDEAFLRRIHTRIDFIVPAPPERKAIWDRNLPASAPQHGIDTEWLARQFELAGGPIRNAAVQAAFIAASAGIPITMDCVVQGISQEFRKLGRILREREFGEYFSIVAPMA